MRLVIVHKNSSAFVNLYYPTASAARDARNRALREAAEKRSNRIAFGPDAYGQDVLIHVECLGSADVLAGDAPMELADPVKAKKDAEERARGNGGAPPLIVPAMPLPVKD